MKSEIALERLCSIAEEYLGYAPDEDECTDEENEIFAELANLYNALRNYGYDAKQPVEDSPMKIYGFTVVNSEGYQDGSEACVFPFTEPEAAYDKAYETYKSIWNEFEENGSLNGNVDLNDNECLSRSEFINTMKEDSIVIIQLDSSHVQFEYFEKEIIQSVQ